MGLSVEELVGFIGSRLIIKHHIIGKENYLLKGVKAGVESLGISISVKFGHKVRGVTSSKIASSHNVDSGD